MRSAPPAVIPTSTCCWCRSISSRARAGKARSTCAFVTSTMVAPQCGCERSSGAEREQPISPSLIRILTREIDARGALARDDAVFRSRHGRPITRRRYNTIFDRAVLPTVGRPHPGLLARAPLYRHQRHRTCRRLRRRASLRGPRPTSVTGLYLRARPCDVAAAVAVLTDEPHPLAEREPASGHPELLM